MTYQHVVGFGEAMLRLTSPPGAAVETSSSFRASVGGAELNGLIAAVRAGLRASWVSSLPHGALGELVLRHVRANGVEPVIVPPRGAEPVRLGLYFLEMSAPPRSPHIIYDRRGSAFERLDPGALAWEELLDADTCLYVTGITPPLGGGPRKAMDDAVRTARDVGAPVAMDVNFRQSLWSREECAAWLASTLGDVDIVAASPGDLRSAGVDARDPFVAAVERYGLQAAVTVAKERTGDTVELEIRVVTPDGEHRAEARATIVDRIGAGDAMFGTFLALLPQGDVAAATERALGAAVTCYGLFGDALVADPWDRTETRGVVR